MNTSISARNRIQGTLACCRRRDLTLLRTKLLLEFGEFLDGDFLLCIQDLVNTFDLLDLDTPLALAPIRACIKKPGNSHSASACPRCHSSK